MLLLENVSNFGKEEEEEADDDDDDDDDDKEPCSCSISLIRSIGAVMVLANAPAIAPAIAFLKASPGVVVAVLLLLLLLVVAATELSVSFLPSSFHSGLDRFILKVLY